MAGIALAGINAASGNQLGGGNAVFRVNGIFAVVAGDPVAGHGSSPHSSASMLGGSPFFRINGIPVIRAGDAASCGHVTNGYPLFNIP